MKIFNIKKSSIQASSFIQSTIHNIIYALLIGGFKTLNFDDDAFDYDYLVMIIYI